MDDNEKITEANRDDWREAARARAISEAEDSGLRGAERQKFILKRTKMHYEELEKLLGDGKSTTGNERHKTCISFVEHEKFWLLGMALHKPGNVGSCTAVRYNTVFAVFTDAATSLKMRPGSENSRPLRLP